ncbi:MAG: T9SS type A sorting domain-containing protein [Bacteroidales bacterium]|nr:T9SS type A sorting domain-containing protein [Bacteroidales bacterium]
MKKIATILLFLLATSAAFTQPPVAVNDTATGRLGEYVTVNVTANDYSPEGLSFRIQSIFGGESFTDSTITYFFDYETYYNYTKEYVKRGYVIIDENGQIDTISFGDVFIKLNNNSFYDTLDIGNIRTSVYAYNKLSWSGPPPSGSGPDEDVLFEFPKGSGKNTLFTSDLWVGGLDQNGEIHLAADKYRQGGIDYWTGPLSLEEDSVSVDMETVVDWNRVWKLDVKEILYHKAHWSDPGYEPIKNIKEWPAHGDSGLNQAEYLAPFVDVDEDGVYDPYSGDYPLIRGDQCIFFIFNDQRPHTQTGAQTIGLEIHGMAYAFEQPDNDAMNNTIFMSYKIFNRSGITLEDTYIGLWADFDIGYAFDDFVGCDVGRGAFYGYNGEEIDGNGEPGSYGENPPAQAAVILGGPWMDPNGEDIPSGGCDESINGAGFGDGIADNERYGMNKFIYYNNSSGPPQGEPKTAEAYYQYLRGIWLDSTVMEYGGNGHVSSGAYGPAASFMFPGLSDPCYWGTGGEEPFGPVNWTEESSGNEPFDRRGMSSMGPFTLLPGVVQKVDIAYVAARGGDGPLSSVDLLKEYIDIVRQEYTEDSDYFGYQWLGTDEQFVENTRLEVYPNPASTELRVNYDAQGRSVTYTINDLSGREIETGQLHPGRMFSIPVSHLEKGMYVLTVIDEKKVTSVKVLIN